MTFEREYRIIDPESKFKPVWSATPNIRQKPKPEYIPKEPMEDYANSWKYNYHER